MPEVGRPLDSVAAGTSAAGATTGPLLAWVGGEVRPAAEASVSVLDHGFTVGDGVFTTLRTHLGGRPFALDRHLARLRQSAGLVGMWIDTTDDDLRSACDDLLGAWRAAGGSDVGTGEARIRITATSGVGPLGAVRPTSPTTVVLLAGSLPAIEGPAGVVTVPWRRNEHAPTAGAKTTSYADEVVALTQARSLGADDALMGNTSGDVCETTGANVFLVVDDELLTPPLTSGCLPGVVRDLVLEAGCGEEADLPLDVLPDVTEMFLTSTVRGVQAVASLDGRPLRTTRHTTDVQAAFTELLANGVD